eukprot:1955552-Amphidinium_carterae.1
MPSVLGCFAYLSLSWKPMVLKLLHARALLQGPTWHHHPKMMMHKCLKRSLNMASSRNTTFKELAIPFDFVATFI